MTWNQVPDQNHQALQLLLLGVLLLLVVSFGTVKVSGGNVNKGVNVREHLLPWEKVQKYPLPPEVKTPNRPDIGTVLSYATDFDQLVRGYADLHAAILNGTKPKRYIAFNVWQEVGFGNRMQGILSVFAAALVSERALIIDWTEQHKIPVKHAGPTKDYVTMPAFEAIFENPYGIQWIMNGSQRKELKEIDANKKSKSLARDEASKLDVYSLCNNAATDTRPWLVTATWDYNSPIVLMNPFNTHVRDIVEKYTLDKSLDDILPFELTTTFLLANYAKLLVPKAHIRQRIEEKRNILFPKDTEVLSVHLRTTHPSISFKDDSIEKIADCILLSNVKAVFVASDSLAYKKKLQQKLEQIAPNKTLFLSLDTATISRDNMNSSFDAITEMYLLSAADKILVQGGSTFGRVASAIGGIHEPTIFKDNTCVRKMTSELCYYNLYKLKTHSCYERHGIHQPPLIYSDHKLCWVL